MSGIGLALTTQPSASPRWWPDHAAFAADFVARRFMAGNQARAFSEIMSFARPSPAWAMSKTGTLQAYPVDAPRLTDAGLLLEGAATNVLRRSTGLSDASAWSAEGFATTTGNKQTFGALVLEQCAVTAPSAFPKFKSLDTLALADQDYGVVSFFALTGSASPLRTHVYDGTGNTATSWTVSGGTFSKGGTIENNPALTRHIGDGMDLYPNGLVRLWTSFRNVSGGPLTYAAYPHIQGTTGVPAMASACWVGGHQLEKGRWPTSLVITNGSAVTRAADSLSLPAATAGVGSAPSFAIAAQWLGGHTGFPWLFSLNDGSAANEIGLYVAANAGSLNRKVSTAGTAQTDGSVGIANLAYGDHISAAMRVATNDLKTWARRNSDGPLESSDDTVVVPSVGQLQIGAGQGGNNHGAVLVEQFYTGSAWNNSILSD